MCGATDERRLQPRVVYPGISVQYERCPGFLRWLFLGKESMSGPVPAEDISEGGIRIETDDGMSVGQRFLLEIAFEEDIPALQIEGVIAWQTPCSGEYHYKTGIEFVNVDESTAAGISLAVKKLIRSVL